MKLSLLLIILLSPIITYSKFTKYEVTNLKSTKFTLIDACKGLGHKHTIIANAKNDQIDCMGNKISAITVCKNRLTDSSNLMRGIINKENMVLCQTASRAILTVICDKKDRKYCDDVTIGCEKIKSRFAVNLEAIHQSITEEAKTGLKQLNCYFSKRIDYSIKL